MLVLRVDLRPRIDKNFFFSSDDPQFQNLKRLEEMFSLPPQLILTAEGDIRSRPYLERVAGLTDELRGLDGVTSVFSLGSGPSSVEGALKSPLWSRLVIASAEKGSNFLVILEDRPGHGELIESVKTLMSRYQAGYFRLSITGVPFIVHEIQRQLIDDMVRFTLAAILIFSIVIFLVYRSGWILMGAMVCAATAAILDFLLLWALRIEPGPLSANLWSIVFVLTLSHVVFISGSWEHLARTAERGSWTGGHHAKEALRRTGAASLWSMLTNSLGFATLLFTAAKPIRQFGLAGLVGAVLAMAVAYAVFPSFLRMARLPLRAPGPLARRFQARVAGHHPKVVALAVVAALLIATGYRRIDTQPPVFSYFERGGQLRADLQRIDQLGGVSPLYLAVSDPAGQPLEGDELYFRLWRLQLALERHAAVGAVLSLPLLLSEFVRSPFASYLTWDAVYAILDLRALGEPGRGFITADRRTALFLLRMKESELRQGSRSAVIEEFLRIARAEGFTPVLTGGLFQQTGELSELVSRSLLQGGFGLGLMLFAMALAVSRSLAVALAVVLSLALVPLAVLGFAGYLGLPLEIISTPGINLALGLGVDETIHLIHHARISGSMEKAKTLLWKPISASSLMLTLGFSVFWLSHFPPTQNLGWLVVFGSATALVTMLWVFPAIAERLSEIRRRFRPRSSRERPLGKAA